MKKFHQRYCRQTLSESENETTQAGRGTSPAARSDLRPHSCECRGAARKGTLCASAFTQKAFSHPVHLAYLPSYEMIPFPQEKTEVKWGVEAP